MERSLPLKGAERRSPVTFFLFMILAAILILSAFAGVLSTGNTGSREMSYSGHSGISQAYSIMNYIPGSSVNAQAAQGRPGVTQNTSYQQQIAGSNLQSVSPVFGLQKKISFLSQYDVNSSRFGSNPLSGPSGMNLDASDNVLYVAYSGSGYVAALNTVNGSIESLISTAPYGNPTDVVYLPQTGLLYVTTTFGLEVLNPVNGKLILFNPAAGGGSLFYDPLDGLLFVPTGINFNFTIALFDPSNNSIVGHVKGVSGNPYPGFILDSQNGMIYAGGNSNIINVINATTAQLAANITLPVLGNEYTNGYGTYLSPFAFDPALGEIFAASPLTGSVSPLNGTLWIINASTNTVIKNVTLPGGITDAIYLGSTRELYLSHISWAAESAVISEVNPVSWKVRNIPVEYGGFDCFVYSGSTGTLYASNLIANSLAMLDPSTGSVGFLPRISSLDSIVVDRAANTVYVDGAGGELAVLNGTTLQIEKYVRIGEGPAGMAYDSDNGLLYVANTYSSNVSVIDTGTNSVIGTISGIRIPLDVVFDAADNEIFVSTSGSGIYVINGTSNAILTVIPGLYEISSLVLDTSSNMIYGSSIFGGVVEINAGNRSLVRSAGIPEIADGLMLNSVTGTLYVFGVNVDASSTSLNYIYILNKTTLNQIGNIEEVGYSNETLGGYLLPRYSQIIMFTWSRATSVSAANNSALYQISGAGGFLANSYGIMQQGNNGSLLMLGNEDLNVLSVMYRVTFNESGLAPGTTWSVDLNGTTGATSSDSLTIMETNGTYGFSVHFPSGYELQGVNSSLTVNGKNESIHLAFIRYYNVTFTESGLPSGILWSVNLSGGKSYSSTSATISFSEPDGTYSYTISTSDTSYRVSQATGSFSVNGAAVSEGPVIFSELAYTITFTESGLPSGTVWYVNLTDGQKYSSDSSAITFSEPNGTYSYSVASADSHYAVANNGDTFSVSGHSLSVQVAFGQTTSSSPHFPVSNLSSDYLYSIIAVIIILAVAATLIAVRMKRRNR